MMNACRRWVFLALVVLTAAVVGACDDDLMDLMGPYPQGSFPPKYAPICYPVQVGSEPASGDPGQLPQTNKVCFH